MVRRSYRVGKGPAILLSTTDHRKLYTANWADDSRSVIDLKSAAHSLRDKYQAFERQRQLALVMFKSHADSIAAEQSSGDKIHAMRIAQVSLESTGEALSFVADEIKDRFEDELAEVPELDDPDPLADPLIDNVKPARKKRHR